MKTPHDLLIMRKPFRKRLIRFGKIDVKCWRQKYRKHEKINKFSKILLCLFLSLVRKTWAWDKLLLVIGPNFDFFYGIYLTSHWCLLKLIVGNLCMLLTRLWCAVPQHFTPFKVRITTVNTSSIFFAMLATFLVRSILYFNVIFLGFFFQSCSCWIVNVMMSLDPDRFCFLDFWLAETAPRACSACR